MNNSECHFETQEEDEKVVLLLRAHPITNIVWEVTVVFLALLGLGLLLAAYQFLTDFPLSNLDLALLFLLWLLMLVGYSLQRYLYWFFNVYIVTNKKLVDVDYFNLFYKQISETPLENIQDSTHSEGGLLQTNFDYGDLFVQTAGEQENFEFINVPDPDGVQKKIMSLASEARERLGTKTI